MAGAEPGRGGAVTVLVVGAGPTGLALAAQLVAFGIDVRVVEQRLDDQPSRAFIVQPRTLEVLTPTGIAERLVARGDRSARARLRSRRQLPAFAHRIARWAGRSGNGSSGNGPSRDGRGGTSHGGGDALVSLARPGEAETPYPFLLALPQVEVEHAIGEHLAERGLRVERGVRLRNLELTGDGVRCHLVHRSGHNQIGDEQIGYEQIDDEQIGYEQIDDEIVEELTAAWVVGCDGADSTVRRCAGIPFPTRVYRPRLLLADVDLDGDIDPETVHGVIDSAGAVFLFPFPHHDGWRLLTVLDPDPDPGYNSAQDQVLVDDLVHRSFDGAVTVRRLRWVERVELRRGQAARYRNDRVLLAGDAAHVHSPAGAQGMNTGLHDAVNLGWKLALVASGRSAPDLLDTYQSERWPVARWTRRLTDAAFLFEAGHVPPIGWLRRNIAPWLVPLARGRSLPAPLFRLLGGLWTRYSRSVLAEEGRPRLHRGVRAGGRVPDGELRVDGRTARLHHLLHPPGFHVLLCDNRPGTTFDWPAPDSPEGLALTSVGPVPLSFHRLSTFAAPGVAHDPDGRLLRRLGVSGTAVQLIRPDGYLGYRAAGTDLAGLAHHLDRYRRTG